MIPNKKTLIFAISLISNFFYSLSYAHQPVMDMAPRWEEGYGFQLRQESFGSDKLMNGNSKTSNPLGLKRYVNITWLEGVYTFKPSTRITFKMPYVNQSRTKNVNAQAVKQKNSGVGDLIFGVPLKYYRNNGAITDNFSFTPSIRIPTGSSSGDFPISDGSLDLGLSFSHSLETPKYYTLVDLFYWINNEGKYGMHEGNELGLDVNLGYHPYHNNDNNTGIFMMLDISARHNEKPNSVTLTTASGGKRIQTGPVLMLYKDNIMLRAEYKFLAYEKINAVGLSRGNEFSAAIGITF